MIHRTSVYLLATMLALCSESTFGAGVKRGRNDIVLFDALKFRFS